MATRALLGFAGLLLLAPPPAAATNQCEFKLGFKALRDLIPDIVGVCLSHELHDPATGNTIQTTWRPGGATGMLVWRKADNWTAFTDGATTWIIGPEGLASRPNAGPPFAREAPAPAATPAVEGIPGGAIPAIGDTLLADPLTAPGALFRAACPSGRNVGEFAGEGLLLKVTGRCRAGERQAARGLAVRNLSFADGQVSLQVKAVSGHERVVFLLGIRQGRTARPD